MRPTQRKGRGGGGVVEISIRQARRSYQSESCLLPKSWTTARHGRGEGGEASDDEQLWQQPDVCDPQELVFASQLILTLLEP
jgi:hypothetical protein